jgi:drug/metabolite transporter (DMT)-like permease
MQALGNLGVESYIFFPATTGGSTIVVAFISAVFLGEHPGKLGWTGLAVGFASLILLGITS